MKTYLIDKKGKNGEWYTIEVSLNKDIVDQMPDNIDEEIKARFCGELRNKIPFWIARAGLAIPWCFLQDIYNFRIPFRK